jgi:hypothetical protein
MKLHGLVFLILSAAFSGCARDTITALDGTFRSTEPYAPRRSPPVYLEAVFTKDGSAEIYLTDSSGRLTEPRKDVMKYTIDGRMIKFSRPDSSHTILFDPPSIEVTDSHTLKLFQDGRLTLKKKK